MDIEKGIGGLVGAIVTIAIGSVILESVTKQITIFDEASQKINLEEEIKEKGLSRVFAEQLEGIKI